MELSVLGVVGGDGSLADPPTEEFVDDPRRGERGGTWPGAVKGRG